MDTKLTNINGAYIFKVYRENTKLPSPWTSKTPKCYKRNTVNGDLHRSKRISSNFQEEIPVIKKKFMEVDYPLSFINSVVNEFQKGKECDKSSEPSKHLRSNINHYFIWAVISNAPKNTKTKKNLEASYIAL